MPNRLYPEKYWKYASIITKKKAERREYVNLIKILLLLLIINHTARLKKINLKWNNELCNDKYILSGSKDRKIK